MEQRAVSLFAQPLAIWERDGLKAALTRAGLPTDDLADAAPLFWRFERDDTPVGFAGIEMHGTDALLRSLVTLPPVRRQGVGAAIVAKMETEAVARGARAIFLLTLDSAPFFAKRGYAPCPCDGVPSAIAATAQFGLFPSSATAMMKQL